MVLVVFVHSEVYLEVNNYFENRTIVNVVATIFGSQEPDHPVLLGTHRDTWVFGAVDATGATGTLLEIAQSLGSLRVAGWRPGRTIMLCSWDASEYCMLGSTEFAEDHAKALLLNAVAYMNVDFCVAGRDYVLGRASPLLIPVMYEAAKKVKSPNNPNMSIYDEMLSVVPGADGKPIISTLAAGSDYTPFIQTLGIPSGDFAYSPNPKTSPFGFYPMYHTIHDSFTWMKKYVDFDFTYHLAIGKLWLRAALHLATTPIIPFGVVEYGYHLHKMAMSLNESNYDILMKENISLDFLYESIESFKISAQSLQNAADYVNSQHLNETARLKMWRILNSNLLGVERSLIVSEGLPGRPSLKYGGMHTLAYTHPWLNDACWKVSMAQSIHQLLYVRKDRSITT
jgi:N-acetylated-alpha-linked acidic dipeptidase